MVRWKKEERKSGRMMEEEAKRNEEKIMGEN